MDSLWSDDDARTVIRNYSAKGVNEDLALRVYTSRLLGRDPRLVLHGGGNTSVKTRLPDLFGESVEVLCVKGSGWDMAEIEPPGLPAVRLDALRRLRRLDALSDEDMVAFQRANLLDPASPNPSVETLFHAFLPQKFVDHTHSTAVLALSDQDSGEEIVREVYEGRLAILPYVMPGFTLAKAAAEAYEAKPEVQGLLLGKHGIFTFGETAREAYERMIAMVTRAEARIARGRNRVFAPRPLPGGLAGVAEIAPILRGAIAESLGEGRHRRWVLDFRTSPAILDYVAGAELARYSQAGVVTPDHTIRTKNWPLIATAPEAGRLDAFQSAIREEVAAFARRYEAYFTANNKRLGGIKKPLDPMPRVILVPGIGLFGIGADKAAARIAADIAVSTVETITNAESIGRYRALDDAELFEMEYWSLEQAKLSKAAEKPLARQIAVVTGGAGTIGLAIGRAFAGAGAEIVLIDRDPEVSARAKKISRTALGLACDVTDEAQSRQAFETIAEHFGGVDIVALNAGAAWQGRIGDVSLEVMRASFELNFWSHQIVASAAVRIMRAQGTGGCLLFNVSKQAVNPGPDFGPYGIPKAALMALMRQYALDHARDGIRANAVNADRIRSGLLTDEMIENRARARGVSERSYMSGNLLGREVTAEDVAQAFLDLSLALKTTASVTTVDGGNIAAALR